MRGGRGGERGRGGEGKGKGKGEEKKGKGGEGTKSQRVPVLMNVVNNVHCFGSIRRTCHKEGTGNIPPQQRAQQYNTL